jgi:hypothetical protein
MRGSKSSLIIRQGKEEGFIPELFIEPNNDIDLAQWQKDTENRSKILKVSFRASLLFRPGMALK